MSAVRSLEIPRVAEGLTMIKRAVVDAWLFDVADREFARPAMVFRPLKIDDSSWP
jgi:hypothetical protein